MRVNIVLGIGLLFAAGLTLSAMQAPGPSRATLFEGARLIAGDGNVPIENSAFLVENDRFTRVGRRGALQAPPDAARVDLRGLL